MTKRLITEEWRVRFRHVCVFLLDREETCRFCDSPVSGSSDRDKPVLTTRWDSMHAEGKRHGNQGRRPRTVRRVSVGDGFRWGPPRLDTEWGLICHVKNSTENFIRLEDSRNVWWWSRSLKETTSWWWKWVRPLLWTSCHLAGLRPEWWSSHLRKNTRVKV